MPSEGLEERAVRRILRGGHEGVHDEAVLVEPGDHRARRPVVAEAITDAYDERLEARTRQGGDLALRATAARGVELVGPVEQLRDARDVAFGHQLHVDGQLQRREKLFVGHGRLRTLALGLEAVGGTASSARSRRVCRAS